MELHKYVLRGSITPESNSPKATSIDVVLPVYNEESQLRPSVEYLFNFLTHHLHQNWQITIANNGSTDNTIQVGRSLANQYQNVRLINLPEKGRGRALKKVWLESEAEILSYMDIDLSTDLNHFQSLLVALISEGYDLAIGSRLAKGAMVTRSLKREILSRGYIFLIHALFQTQFTDAQCGFKAITKQAARAIIPRIRDNEWFFDTELLITAESSGFRIKDIPVCWNEDSDSRVKIIPTIIRDIRGLLRLRFKFPNQKP